MYDAINTAGTGLQTYHTWLDVISNNIANVNDSNSPNGKVYEEQYLTVGEIGGGESGVDAVGGDIGQGVKSVSIETDGKNGELVEDPSDPRADAKGYVRRTNVDLAQEMGFMIAAQRGFQANAQTVDRAKEVYEAAIGIGKGI
jgi:flagellar basal-body rod protein FlgC